MDAIRRSTHADSADPTCWNAVDTARAWASRARPFPVVGWPRPLMSAAATSAMSAEPRARRRLNSRATASYPAGPTSAENKNSARAVFDARPSPGRAGSSPPVAASRAHTAVARDGLSDDDLAGHNSVMARLASADRALQVSVVLLSSVARRAAATSAVDVGFCCAQAMILRRAVLYILESVGAFWSSAAGSSVLSLEKSAGRATNANNVIHASSLAAAASWHAENTSTGDTLLLISNSSTATEQPRRNSAVASLRMASRSTALSV